MYLLSTPPAINVWNEDKQMGEANEKNNESDDDNSLTQVSDTQPREILSFELCGKNDVFLTYSDSKLIGNGSLRQF